MTATLPAESLARRRAGPSPRALAAALILGVLALRILYLFALSPWQLMGDEAYYWEWSRHLAPCYYEKGPATAWMIWPSVHLFGSTEGAVRLPMAVVSALSAWAVAALAEKVSGDERAGLLAAVAFVLIPAYQANAQITSQDGPMILAWAGLAIVGLRLFRRWEADLSTWAEWLAVGALCGVAFLFKQTAVLFLPSFVVYALLRRKELRWRWTLAVEVLASAATFLLAVSPMIWWNVEHHWPIIQHTLGHLGAGGDQKETIGSEWSPLWLPTLVGAQLGAIGPAIGLMAWAGGKSWKERRPAELWLLCAAVPSIAFFVLLSCLKEVLGNWPLPSFAPLVALIGVAAVGPLGRWNTLRASGEKRRPHFAGAWNTMLVYGCGAWVLISFAPAIRRIPYAGRIVPHSAVKRGEGHRAHAAWLVAKMNELRTPNGPAPVLIAGHYMQAALDAFYLPGQPTVYDADVLQGKHPTSYEYWTATDLNDPALLGRPVLLDGSDATQWTDALKLNNFRTVGRRLYAAESYDGIAPSVAARWPQPPPGKGVSSSGHSDQE